VKWYANIKNPLSRNNNVLNKKIDGKSPFFFSFFGNWVLRNCKYKFFEEDIG